MSEPKEEPDFVAESAVESNPSLNVTTLSDQESRTDESTKDGNKCQEESCLENHHAMDTSTSSRRALSVLVHEDESIMNSTTPEAKECKRWGGSMYATIRDCGGSLDVYSDECLTLHGLQQAFDRKNGWIRTTVYALVWTALGVVMVVLFLPVVQDYRDKNVTLHLDLNTENNTEGLPLPVVTVCPHGSGIQCDCLLWRALHCRYFERKEYTWMARFDEWSCWTNFDFKSDRLLGKYPAWKDANCGDFDDEALFSTLYDPCGPERFPDPPPAVTFPLEPVPNGTVPEWGQHEPTLYDGEEDGDPTLLPDFNFTLDKIPTWLDMLDLMLAREKDPEGPYMTWKELAFYAGRRIDGDLRFYRNNDVLQEEVPAGWVSGNFFERSHLTICTQLRPRELPDILNGSDSRQRSPGSANGILMVANNISVERYPLRELPLSTAALDVHINYDDGRDDRFLNRYQFQTVAGGHTTSLETVVETLKRYQGWGSTASRTCKHTHVPRAFCAQEEMQKRVAAACNCTGNATIQVGPINELVAPEIMDCSASANTEQKECVESALADSMKRSEKISIEECPYTCDSTTVKTDKQSSTLLSTGQLLYLEQLIDQPVVTPEQALVLQVGFGNLAITTLTEQPSTPLGALLGQLGGLLGLWCGISVSLFLEHLEYLVIAILFGTGCYNASASPRSRRKNLTERVHEATSHIKSSTASHGSESLVLRRNKREGRS